MNLNRRPTRPTSWQLQDHGRAFPPHSLHDSWRDYLYWDIALEESYLSLASRQGEISASASFFSRTRRRWRARQPRGRRRFTKRRTALLPPEWPARPTQQT